MKPCIFSALALLMYMTSSAQIEFGLKAGLSSYDLAKEGIIIKNPGQDLEWNIKNSGFGHHFGVYTRLSLFGVFVEPALLFNSNTVNYDIKTYSESGVFNTIRKEKYNQVDLPVIAGFKMGVLRFQGGVVSHFFINSLSDVVDVQGYEQRFKNATYGWQAGTGLDLWKLRLDLMFEGNFEKFGDHITIKGQSYSFADTPSRLMLTMGYKF